MITLFRMSYSKLHSSIVNSSLWTEGDSVRLLFITLLALCDRDGCVYGTRLGFNRIANIEQDEADAAWGTLLGPDPNSSDKMRAPENQGRRIEEIPGGFRLLNFDYYRGLRNDDDRREQNRIAQAKFKARSAKVSQGKPDSASKSQGKPISEAEADTEPEVPPTGGEGGDSSKKDREDREKLRIEIGSWFRRKPSTPFSEKELKAFRKLPVTSDEDLEVLREYYVSGMTLLEYQRRDVSTLLNNWNGEIDRAKKWKNGDRISSDGVPSISKKPITKADFM